MQIIETADLTPADTEAMSSEVKHWLYNGFDCCVTREVFDVIAPQLDPTTTYTYHHALSLQGPVLDMKLRGVRVDQRARAQALASLEASLRAVEHNLYRLICDGIGFRTIPLDPANPKTAKGEFNWGSPKLMQELLYDVMRLPRQRNKNGITADRNALEKLGQYFLAQPIVNHILTLRDLGKKIGVLKTAIDDDGRMRTSYNIAGTETGRFSSNASDFGTGTNAQNITDELRRPLIADPGMKFAYIDLEQAESRVVGAICWNLFNRGAYLDACESGDLHTTVTKLARRTLAWTGDPHKDRSIADSPGYRHLTYRDLSKKLGHGCLTEDHEVLTPEGWISITAKPLTILQWSPTQSSFTNVTAWTDHLYTGEIQVFEGNSISASMTHDHRVPYASDTRNPVKERPAAAGPGAKMPLGHGYIGGPVKVNGALIAACICDGHKTAGNQYRFNLRKQRKIDRLHLLCAEAGVSIKQYADGTFAIDFTCRKDVGAYMLQWARDSLLDFITEYKHWDGHIGPTAITLFNKDKLHLEWLQTFGRILGIGGQISKEYTTGFGGTCRRLNQNNRQWASGSSITHTTTPAKDVRVLCPTVETGWFYVRRNGKIFVTGNTNYGGQPTTMARHSQLPVPVIQEFQGAYFSAFPEIPMWHSWVKKTLLDPGYIVSLSGRKRWFFGRRDDPSTVREAIAFDPQGSVGDILNIGMRQVWLAGICELLLQVHDAILIQYPEEQEAEVLPKVMELIQVPITLKNDRLLQIPCDCAVGWNFGKHYLAYTDKAGVFHPEKNPDGLAKWKGPGSDTRRRQGNPHSSRLDFILG